MAEEPGTGFIKWPTDAEVRAHFDDYVTAVGRIAYAWKNLHEHLGAIFVQVVNARISMWSLRFGIRRIAIAHNERCSAQRSWLSRVSLALFAFLELLSQAALTGRRLFVPVISDPGDWLRCAVQRQPAPHIAEAVHQRFDIVIAVQRGRGQAQAFGAARHGRVS